MEKIKSRLLAIYTMITVSAAIMFGVLVTTLLVALGLLMLTLLQIISFFS
jgi:hypothetical protein